MRTVEQARQRREELVTTFPFCEEEMRRRAEAYELDARQLATYEEVEALDWLIEHAAE